MKSTDLFFRNDRLIRPFFARPFTTAVIFFCFGSIITLLAWGLHLGSIVSAIGCNVGFFYRPNWALMYLFLLPTIFCLMSSILAESSLTVNFLSSPEIKVIEPALPNNDQSFEGSLYALMGKWRPLIYRLALGAALIITGLSVTLLLWKPSVTGDDWAVVMPRFAIFVFLVQGVYIFLGVFWVLKFASFILSFIHLAFGFTPGFRLNLMLYDPERRLGLGMLGDLLNRFGIATLLLEIYIAVYGLQAAADIHKACLVQYVQDTFKSNPIGQRFSLEPFLYFSGAGVFVLFVLAVLLWIVYIAIPIFYLRPRLSQMQQDCWRHHAREFESANLDNDETLTKRLERRFKALNTSSFWPNGPTAGVGLVFALLVIPLLASPLGPLLVTSGVLVAAYKAYKALRSVA